MHHQAPNEETGGVVEARPQKLNRGKKSSNGRNAAFFTFIYFVGQKWKMYSTIVLQQNVAHPNQVPRDGAIHRWTEEESNATAE